MILKQRTTRSYPKRNVPYSLKQLEKVYVVFVTNVVLIEAFLKAESYYVFCSVIKTFSERLNTKEGTTFLLRKPHRFVEIFFIVNVGGDDLCILNKKRKVFANKIKAWMKTFMEHHIHIKYVFICELSVCRTTKYVYYQTNETQRTIVNNILEPCWMLKRI